jgi:hypothetical protein
MVIERHVFHADLGVAGGARLLEWCRELGADSFTFTVIGTPPQFESDAAAIEAPLEPFRLPTSQIRSVPEGESGSFWSQVKSLWELNDATQAMLLRNFPRGLLTYVPSDRSWCEDPWIFREGELMLGLISHEGEGVLRIRANEQLSLDQLEIPYRLKGEWVGY